MSIRVVDFNHKFDAPIAVSLGFFDCIHKGHEKLVRSAISYSRIHGTKSALLTFVNDPNLTFGKEKQIYTFDDRVKVLDKCGLDVVVGAHFDQSFADMSPLEFLHALTSNFNVKAIFVGADYTFGRFAKGNVETLRSFCVENGIYLEVVPFETANGEKISTSTLKNYVKNGQVDALNEFLAIPYFISGQVVHARHKGTGMGFPTTNILPDAARLPLCNGIYATFCEIDGKIYKSMTNVGTKPTFSDDSVSVETYIIDFQSDVYGKEITVYFIKKMRDIKKFVSQNDLRAQLDLDEKNSIAILNGNDIKPLCNVLTEPTQI